MLTGNQLWECLILKKSHNSPLCLSKTLLLSKAIYLLCHIPCFLYIEEKLNVESLLIICTHHVTYVISNYVSKQKSQLLSTALPLKTFQGLLIYYVSDDRMKLISGILILLVKN